MIEIPIGKGCYLILTPEEYEQGIKQGENMNDEQMRSLIFDFIGGEFFKSLKDLGAGQLLSDPALKKADAAWRRGDLNEVIPLLEEFLVSRRAARRQAEALLNESLSRVAEDRHGSLFDFFPEEAFPLEPHPVIDITEAITTPGICLVPLVSDEGMGTVRLIEALARVGGGDLIISSGKAEPVVACEGAAMGFSYLISRAESFGVDLTTTSIHVDLSAIGDGNSGGLPVFLAMLSAASGHPVGLIAATGSVSLGGKVGAVGGITEKIIAAYQAGVSRVIIPRGSAGGLDFVPAAIRRKMEIVPVGTIDEAIAASSVLSTTRNERRENGPI